MTISLKIDNLDALPDGGPLGYRAQGRGFEIGREHRDWTLPDPNMSSPGVTARSATRRAATGCTISRNGTFVNGSRQRIKNPHQLGRRRPHPDRPLFRDGVDRRGRGRAGGRRAFAAGAVGQARRIWDTGAPSPPPIDRRELMPPQRAGQRSADFAEQFLEMPIKPLPELDNGRAPAQRPATPTRSARANRRKRRRSAGMRRRRARLRRRLRSPATSRCRPPFSLQSEGFAPPLAPAHRRCAPHRPRAVRGPACQLVARRQRRHPARHRDRRRRLSRCLPQRPAGDVAAEIGMVLRTVIEELALLLKARAAAKVWPRAATAP